jgi:hypothetical protein
VTAPERTGATLRPDGTAYPDRFTEYTQADLQREAVSQARAWRRANNGRCRLIGWSILIRNGADPVQVISLDCAGSPVQLRVAI